MADPPTATIFATRSGSYAINPRVLAVTEPAEVHVLEPEWVEKFVAVGGSGLQVY